MRLFTYIKNNGNFTKSKMLEFYNEDRILVNKEKKNLSYIVKQGDVITIDGKVLERIPYEYYLYNKPKGLVCTNDKNNSDSYLNMIKLENRIYCVGRLDKDSRGLLILTNDGKYFDQLMSPDNHVEKEYLVETKNDIDEEFITKLTEPMVMDGKKLKPVTASLVDKRHFKIILVEGKYHQVRRMVKACKNTVVDLQRIRIGKFVIDNIKEGEIKKIEK